MQYHWNLNHTRGSVEFTLLVSASKPCEGFRVWLHHELSEEEQNLRSASAMALEIVAKRTAAAAAAAEGRGGGGGGDTEADKAGERTNGSHPSVTPTSPELSRHVDVTSLASRLPPLHPAARLQVSSKLR